MPADTVAHGPAGFLRLDVIRLERVDRHQSAIGKFARRRPAGAAAIGQRQLQPLLMVPRSAGVVTDHCRNAERQVIVRV